MDGLDELSKRFGVKLPTPDSEKKIKSLRPRGDDSVATVLDSEFKKLGYGNTARLSILGDVGRENAWNRDTIFKGHSDPKNKVYNRGIISWQGDRRDKLDNHLKQEGVLGRNDDEELRGMARFMDKELRESFPQAHQKLKGAKSTYDASEALREYIKYVPDAPYNTFDPDFRVKNNAEWAKRAKELKLGIDTDIDALNQRFLTPQSADFSELSRRFGVTTDAPINADGKSYVLPENVGGTQLPPVNPTGVPLKTNATVMPPVAEQVVAEPPIAVQQPSVLQDRPQPYVETPVQQTAPTQRRVAKGQSQPVQQAPERRYETSEAVISDLPEEQVGLPVEAIQRGQEGNAIAERIQLPESIKTRKEANKYIADTLRAKYGNINIPEQYTLLNETFVPGQGAVIDYDTLKSMGVDTDALISQKMAESRVETPQPDLNLKGLPKFSQVDKTEDELRDQYRKEEIAKLDPSSVNRWISELIKNPFSRAMDAYDLATGQITDIDKIVNERINALPQSGHGRRSVEQYNPENDAPFPIAKAASLGSNFYKGLVVDNFAPMLETAGYGQALFDNYILGKPTAVKDTSLFKSASAMRDTHEKGLAKMPDAFGEEQFTRTLGQAAGQMLMAAGGVATLNPTNVGRMTMIQGAMTEVAQVSAEAYRAAIARPGTTEDQARLAAMLVAPTGLVGGLSEAKLFSSLKRIQGLDLATNGKFSSQLMAKFKAVASSGNQVGISELIEEGIQGLGGEVGAQLAYRKNDRDLKGFLKDIDEMAKNAILAYPVGAILGGGTATAQIMAESGSEADTAPAMPIRQSRTDALLKTEVPQKTEPVIEPIKMGAERTAPNPLNETKTEVLPQPTSVEEKPLVQTQTVKDNSGNFEPPVKETKQELTPAEQTAAIKASSAEVAKAEAEIETARKAEIYETAKQALSLPFIEPKALSTKAEQAKAQKAMANKYEFTDVDENGDEITDTYTGFQRQKELKKQSKKLDTLLKCLNG